jgi:hypothetical protein
MAKEEETMNDNFTRMLQVVNDCFDTRNDPDQISVTPEERDKLAALHSATLSELANADGPIVWVLLVPTTQLIMARFLAGSITEKQVLDETMPGSFDAIYLCSASVLPEFRKQGLAKKVVLDAIAAIREDHPIDTLFYWPFSEEGKMLARSVACTLGLQLLEKE